MQRSAGWWLHVGAVLAAAHFVGVVAPAHAQQVRATVERETGVGAGAPRAVAVWVHPTQVARSLVLVAEGDAGLAAYGLDGGLVDRVLEGRRVVDVDVSLAPPTSLGVPALVLAVDGATGQLLLLGVEPSTGVLGLLTGTEGLDGGAGAQLGALYVPRDRSRAYVLATSPAGPVQQRELTREGPQGAFRLRDVRSLSVVPATGGFTDLTVDSAADQLYLVDSLQVRRVPAAEDAGSGTVTVVAAAGTGLVSPRAAAVYALPDGSGYVLVADPASGGGQRGVAVFGRGGGGPYLGRLQVLPVDGGTTPLPVEQLAVQPFAMGTQFPSGVLVTAAQGAPAPVALVRWDVVAAAFEPALAVDPTVDPRAPVPDGGSSPDAGSTPDGGGGSNVGGGGGGGGPHVPVPEPQGCGCNGAGEVPAATGLLGLLAAWRRRRREGEGARSELPRTPEVRSPPPSP